ncbi:N-acetyltransferase [Celeribacter marinus]|uniref:GNAT family N-acetyltransferase n=1 Tax=Celeribacter marinus TaxID=1397108 RepID=UPI0031753D12
MLFKSPDFMRALKRGEEPSVDALIAAAFGGKTEVGLVANLRKSRAIAGEMVLPMDGEIVGYAALSHMISPKGWIALSPMAIHPDHQGRGFGRRFVGMIAQWAELSGQTVVVVGDPAFYTRCGFTPIDDDFTSTNAIDRTLIVGPAKTKIRTLTYPKAFA